MNWFTYPGNRDVTFVARWWRKNVAMEQKCSYKQPLNVLMLKFCFKNTYMTILHYIYCIAATIGTDLKCRQPFMSFYDVSWVLFWHSPASFSFSLQRGTACACRYWSWTMWVKSTRRWQQRFAEKGLKAWRCWCSPPHPSPPKPCSTSIVSLKTTVYKTVG